MVNTNIMYYFYCRHKLGEGASVIGTEITNLFQIKIPLRDGLKNWAESIKILHNEDINYTHFEDITLLFKYDDKNKSCFEHLQFQLTNQESIETQKIQFYALCRYQLSVKITNILDELTELYDTNAPSIVNLNSWVINNWKKDQKANETLIQITEIDLTIDEIEEKDSARQSTDSEAMIEPYSEPNPLLPCKQDSNIRYYFCCRNKLNVKPVIIQVELKQLFENELLPQSILLFKLIGTFKVTTYI